MLATVTVVAPTTAAERAPIGLLEREGLAREDVHLRGRQRLAPEREHGHALLFDEAPPELRICELLEDDRGAWAVPEALQGSKGTSQVLGLEGDHEIEIRGEAGMAVEDDGDPPDHQVAGARRLQGCEHAFEVAVGHRPGGYRGP